MMVAGTISFAGFAVSPIYEICALVFGIGIGLTIDEFALWVHLDDVYWAEEGRQSIDATVIAALARPDPARDPSVRSPPPAALGAVLGPALFRSRWLRRVCLPSTASARDLGFLVPPLAIYGALPDRQARLAWARRFYGERIPQAGQGRAALPPRPPHRQVQGAGTDAIGGSTEDVYEAKVERSGIGSRG